MTSKQNGEISLEILTVRRLLLGIWGVCMMAWLAKWSNFMTFLRKANDFIIQLMTLWYKFKYVFLQDENPAKEEGKCMSLHGKLRGKSRGKIKKKIVRKQEKSWLEKKKIKCEQKF